MSYEVFGTLLMQEFLFGYSLSLPLCFPEAERSEADSTWKPFRSIYLESFFFFPTGMYRLIGFDRQ